MRCTPFRTYLIVTGLFCLGFQVAGIIVESWWRLGYELYNSGSISLVTFEFGQWTVSRCVEDNQREKCIRTSPEIGYSLLELDIGNRSFGQWHLKDWGPNQLTIKILTLVGLALSLVAMFLAFIWFYQYDKHDGGRCGSILTALSWSIDGVVALGAIGVVISDFLTWRANRQLYQVYAEGLSDLQLNSYVYFPWAIVVTGAGAFLALVLALSVVLCTSKQYRV